MKVKINRKYLIELLTYVFILLYICVHLYGLMYWKLHMDCWNMYLQMYTLKPSVSSFYRYFINLSDIETEILISFVDVTFPVLSVDLVL